MHGDLIIRIFYKIQRVSVAGKVRKSILEELKLISRREKHREIDKLLYGIDM